MENPFSIQHTLCTSSPLCEDSHTATNIELNEDLVKKAMRLGKLKSKKDAVNLALGEFVQRHEQMKVLSHFGTVEFDHNDNYKSQRVRERLVFDRIAKSLSPFPTRSMTSEVFVTAAEFFKTCRSKGIQGSSNDFLICAASALWGLPILTKDQDFKRYQKHLPISLASSRK